MARLHVHLSHADGFVRVPNELARSDELSADSFRVLVYLLSHRSGAFDTTMTKSAAVLGIGGERVAAKVRRELITAGYLRETKSRDPSTGQWIYVWHVYDSRALASPRESDTDVDNALTSTDTTSPQVTPGPPNVDLAVTSGNGTSSQVGPSRHSPGPGERRPIKKTNSQEDQFQEDHSFIPTTSGSPDGDPDSEQARDRLASAATEPDEAEPTDPAMDGSMNDQRPKSRKPWADYQAAYDRGDVDEFEVLEFLGDVFGGLDTYEDSTACGMLAAGSHVKAVYYKIRADREMP